MSRSLKGWSLTILLTVFSASACAADTSAPANDHALTTPLGIASQWARERYESGGPGAAYLISKNGTVLLSEGQGVADLEWGRPITGQTVFRLGSISKSITAVAVLHLAEQGHLDIDAQISAYAPNLPPHMGKVTLRQLLSHRSGLAEHVWNPDLLPFIWQPMTTEKVIELQSEVGPEFAPGTRYEYVNFNYVLVAHVIEKVTGRTFVDYIDEDVFLALALNNSHYDWHDKIIPRRAEFYDRRDGKILNAQDVDLTHVSAAGALMSSTEDMGLWMHLLTSGKLISEESLQEAWEAPALPDGTPTSYGLGFNIGTFHGKTFIWHNGLTPGSQGAYGYLPEEGLFVIVLSNGFYTSNTTDMMKDLMTIMLTGAEPKKDKSTNK